MDRRIIPLCLFLLCAVAFENRAQQVYKCVRGPEVSFQSAPCGDGARLARQWDAEPEPPPTPQQLEKQRDAQAQAERDSAYLRTLARPARSGRRRPVATGTAISAARDGARCAKAKQRRDATERRLGLKRTFEDMQRLSRMVYEACR